MVTLISNVGGGGSSTPAESAGAVPASPAPATSPSSEAGCCGCCCVSGAAAGPGFLSAAAAGAGDSGTLAVLGKLLFKSNLLQLLLHIKSNKLLYKLLYRYFITSLKLQSFYVLFQLQISIVTKKQVKCNDQHQNCIKHLIRKSNVTTRTS